jgi:hypothetical protein
MTTEFKCEILYTNIGISKQLGFELEYICEEVLRYIFVQYSEPYWRSLQFKINFILKLCRNSFKPYKIVGNPKK